MGIQYSAGMEELKILRSPNKENSTHTEKIRRISQNLQKVAIEPRLPQPQKCSDQIDLRLRQLEEKMQNFQEFDQKRFELLEESAISAKKGFEKSCKEGKEAFEEFKNSFEFWQSELTQKVQSLSNGAAEFESEMLGGLIGGLSRTAFEEISAEEQRLADSKAAAERKIRSEIDKTRDAFVVICKDQDQMKLETTDAFDKESTLITNKLVGYRTSKKEAEDSIVALIEEFVRKTQEELDKEHKERLKQEDQILTLLDKATGKLNHLSQI